MAGNRNGNRILVPEAEQALERFKYEIASELGVPVEAGTSGAAVSEQSYKNVLDAYKYEVASELGLRGDIEQKGWANMTSRECGRVGGRMGGKIGGQMVKRLVQLAEQNLR